MSEWKEYKLGEIAEIVGGGTPTTSNPEYWGGDIPWLSPKDLTGYKKIYISHGERNITESGLMNSSAKMMPKGTVLFSSRAPIGYVAIAKNPVCTNQGFKSFVCRQDKVLNLFLYYWLKNNVEYFQSLGTGTTFAEISGSAMRDIEISLPPINVQKRIAGVLSSLDDKIDLLHRENATLEALAETLFRHYFIENPDPTWKEGKLGDVAKIGIGRTPPRKETKWFSSSPMDVKWISIKDMGEQGVFIFNTTESLTKDAVETFKIPTIPPDTVVLSFKMTVGRIGITTETMLSNEAIAHFILDDNSPISKEYLYIFLKLFKFETLGSTSSIVTSINSAMIKEMELIIPDKDAMMLFNKQVCPLFEKIKTNQQQIQTLAIKRDSLLPRLISGEVKISGQYNIGK